MSIQKDEQTYYTMEETKKYLAEMREKHADEYVARIIKKRAEKHNQEIQYV